MKICIDHIAKTEGHSDFYASLLNGNVKEAKVITTEGIRLIEGILLGRHFSQVPIITARICGICPIVHSLTAINAIEMALGIRPTKQTVQLRRIMELAQVIHSHTLHLYFLSLPDFFDIEDDLEFIKKHPQQAQATIVSRNFAIKVLDIIAGRVVHPIASEVGGFKTLPTESQLQEILNDYQKALEAALQLVLFTAKVKYPNFSRQTEFICLKDKKEYGIYQGEVASSKGKQISIEEFFTAIKEVQRPDQPSKRATYKGKSFMVGALARLNINHQQLAPEAKKIVADLKLEFPIYNTFYNVLAQAIEVVHCTEEIKRLVEEILETGIREEKSKGEKLKIIALANPQGKTTSGLSAMEAPRGTLFHTYEIDRDGKIVKAEIITPTVMFLNNVEEDLKALIPDTLKLSDKKRKDMIKMLIRAYDPCISCATH